VTLDALPFSSYAIGCVHDENGNGKLDTNLLGIPREVSARQETAFPIGNVSPWNPRR
jgi:uncharacterized protein (DUF2141 family)